MKVPHSEINAKLDEEKAAKAKKPRQLLRRISAIEQPSDSW
jgi:hypothetical protein